MQSCAECGHLSDDDANFCDQCGSRLRPEPPAPVPIDSAATEPERGLGSRWWVWALGAIALLIAAAAGAALVLNDPDATSDEETPGEEAGEPQPTASSPATPDAEEVLAADGTSRVRLAVANCAGCQITALPADGSGAQVATVASGAVEFALRTPSTLGLGFTVEHPDGFGSAEAGNTIVLAPSGVAAGEQVTVSDISDADLVSVCWAGTLAAERSLTVAVELFADGTTPGGLRAWADPAEPVTDAVTAPTADGTVAAGALNGCAAAQENAG
jgi:hypothetical protein